MTRLDLTLGIFLSLSLTPIIKMEHHEIPILSNNTDINNSFTVSSFLNYTATLFNLQNGLDTDDSYDDSVGIMDDYIDGEETALSDDGHDVTDTSRTSLESLDEDDEDSDFNFLANRGRWSYLPKFVEKMCREECNMKGKPFGRLLGTTCQCYCPLNAPKLGLCEKSNSCDRYCSSIGFSRGGDCLYNKVCFCFCRKKEPYDASKVYTDHCVVRYFLCGINLIHHGCRHHGQRSGFSFKKYLLIPILHFVLIFLDILLKTK